MVEWDTDAVATVLHNRDRGIDHVTHWPMRQMDVRAIDWSSHRDRLTAISGGPPCQPFGIGGKKQGHEDHRDMWPEAIRAIREARPQCFLFENVRNLAGPRFHSYLEWIVQFLQHPSDGPTAGESHFAHFNRLRGLNRPGDYRVTWQLVNAADFGAPQIRHRVLIFGVRSDLDVTPGPMATTHSRDRLLWDQYVTGEYWERHGLRWRRAPATGRDQLAIERLRRFQTPPSELPWVTVRDAVADLGDPDGRRNHVFQPGARVYHGHTGSLLDLPAKALKAGDHGVPGGENMMVRDDESVRYFTIREASRLVGLPDDYLFPRSWSESMRQLGNAVPSQLGEAAGRWLTRLVEEAIPTPARRKLRAA
jgi:DNA (cytosine-5)-methyltransferase 1